MKIMGVLVLAVAAAISCAGCGATSSPTPTDAARSALETTFADCAEGFLVSDRARTETKSEIAPFIALCMNAAGSELPYPVNCDSDGNCTSEIPTGGSIQVPLLTLFDEYLVEHPEFTVK